VQVPVLIALGRFDLYDVGAEVRHHRARRGDQDHRRHFHDADALEHAR
jgi:hypothetical protein